MTRSLILKGLVFTAILSLAACGSSHRLSVEAAQETSCPEPRPEVCTMDYDPVCGSSSDGSLETYSNGCSACSNPAVTSYSQGECK